MSGRMTVVVVVMLVVAGGGSAWVVWVSHILQGYLDE